MVTSQIPRKMKIGFFECEGWEEEYINKKYPYLSKIGDINYFDITVQDAIKEGINLGEYDVLSIFIYSKIDEHILSLLKNCKVIITRSTGYDHIDVEYAKRKGIKVYNIYDYGTNTVAEFTILLMLMILRKIKKIFYDYEIHEKIDPRAFRGEELKDKTIGIVGTGNIGTRVIELLQPFNVKILAYSRHKKKDIEIKYNVTYVDKFEDLLKESDIISFHVPLTPQTYHMLNKNNIKYLKKGAYIINTSRGGVIDTEAIIIGIKEGRIKAIAMDVFEGEKLERMEMDIMLRSSHDLDELKKGLAHQILRHNENIIVTPHIAYDTEEAIYRILNTTVDIIISYYNNTLDSVMSYLL